MRGHDHELTDEYLREHIDTDPKVPHHMEQGRRWVSADRYAESQAADLMGGFLKAALWPSGEFDYVEPSYLLTVWKRIHTVDGCAVPLGIWSMPSPGLIVEQPWFPCPECPKKDQLA